MLPRAKAAPRRERRLQSFLVLSMLCASVFATPAHAVPITWVFDSTIVADASSTPLGLGGASVRAFFTFSSTLAPGTGPGGLAANYGPITMDLWVAGELVKVAPTGSSSIDLDPNGIGIKISDQASGAGQDQYKVGAKLPDFFSGTVKGHSVTSFEFQLKDIQGTMFSNTNLPTDLSFWSGVDAVTAKLDLASPSISLTMTSGTLRVPVATPEPTTLLLLGSGLAGLGLWRRLRNGV